jgi:glucosamine--fructose-6-phosphate aminotransferase (isomerizing)
MCGIIGYIGTRDALPILVSCLRKLEYRGYDSCGIAVASDSVEVYKDAVRVDELSKASPKLIGAAGIGHTRWATHGPPTQKNAHPHQDCTGKIAVVHNGVIANFEALRGKLQGEGHEFTSETDSEVIPHLIEKYFDGDLSSAVKRAISDLEGSYALIVTMAGVRQLVAARKDSPMVLGVGDEGNYVASDVPALLDYTNRVMYLEDGDVATLDQFGVRIVNNGHVVEREEQKVLWDVDEARKGGFEHFMLKEIHEQPRVIRNTLAEYSRNPDPVPLLPVMRNLGIESLLMLACGTSYHASLVGKYAIEEMLKLPVRVELASEFDYYSNALARTLAIAVTQSGETADTVKAMRRLREIGCSVLAVTNVVGSSATRVASQTIYTRAGPEMSVAATKSFTAQLMTFYWLAITYAAADPKRISRLQSELRQLPTKVQQVLDDQEAINSLAKTLAKYDNAFFVGRGINYPIALEGALKLKEISYIHAEGQAAGEIKHGTLALFTSKTPVIALVAKDNTYGPMLTSIKEMNARGAIVVAITEEGDTSVRDIADSVLYVPRIDPLFSPVLNAVTLQLLAYYAAKHRGCPIDFPRNLAKSVTVE